MRPSPAMPASPTAFPPAPPMTPDRFAGIVRDYTAADVERLAGSFRIRHTLAEMGARRLWHLLKTEPYVNTLGAMTGMQAVQQVKAGLKAIYLSGWQVAADANTAGQMYPDQSLYPVEFGAERGPPHQRARCAAATRSPAWRATPRTTGWRRSWPTPRPGSAAALNAYELMRAMIEAGAAGRAFRGPAGLGEEMRPSRRQGAGADQPAHPHPERRPPGRRRRGRADRPALPHRCRKRAIADRRRRRARPPVHHRRAHRRRASSASGRASASSTRSPAAWPMRPTPTCCGGRPRTPTSTTRAPSPRRSTGGSRASCWPTTAARRSTGSARWASRRRTRSSARSPPWATGSSSSPWPASTA